MNKENKMEGMAKDLGNTWVVDLEGNPHDLSEVLMQCDIEHISEQMQEMGYRKASEVALKMICKIEDIITKIYNKHIFGEEDLSDVEEEAVMNFSDDISSALAELKKKYSEVAE